MVLRTDGKNTMHCVSKAEVLKKIEWKLRLLLKNPKGITENSGIHNKERKPGDFNTHNTKGKKEEQRDVGRICVKGERRGNKEWS